MGSYNNTGSCNKRPAHPDCRKNGCRPSERPPSSAGISQKSGKISHNGAGQKPGRQNSAKVFNASDSKKNEKRPDDTPDHHLVCISEAGEIKRQEVTIGEKSDERLPA